MLGWTSDHPSMAEFPKVFLGTAEDAGKRLDQYLAGRLTETSRARIQRLVSAKKVLVNGVPAKPSLRLRGAEQITILGAIESPALRAIPEVYDQESCFLAGEVGIVEEEYSGLASTEERVRPMAEGLKKYHAIILPNHGAITRGQNVQQAVFFMLLLEGMAMRNLTVVGAARAMGVTPRPIAPEIAQATKKELSGLKALPMVWEDFMTKLRATDPQLFAN